MLRKFLSLMISLSMLTAAVPAAFAAPDMADGESTETAAEVMETKVPDDSVEVSDKEAETTEPETADIAETSEPNIIEGTPAPEKTEVVETVAPEEQIEEATEPDISLMSTVDSGTCGENLTWTLDDSGTLTISGTGAMTNYSSFGPWYNNRLSINSVVIEDGVTSIGNYAFYNCSALTDVYYNNSFSDFAKIYIGNYNSNFTNATLHCSDMNYNNWGKCGDTVAYFWDSSGTLTISGTGAMTDYHYYNDIPWYSRRSEIKTVVIEDCITSIGEGAFYHCSSLSNVTIPDSVTSIGNYAFCGCDALTSIAIPNSVTSIGGDAFYSCDALTSITIPDSVTSIGGAAFEGCENLDSVYISDLAVYLNISFFNDSANPMYYADKLYLNNRRVSGNLVIPDGITNIPTYAFEGCDGITSVTIPDSVTRIGASAFYNCSRLDNVYITDLSKWCEISFRNASANPLYYAENLYLNDELLTDTVIPNNTVSIGNYAFYNYVKLSSVTIPKSVTFIGSSAFYNCDALTDITIPDSVTSIGSNSFADCNSLSRVTFGSGVTSVGDYAFAGCFGITGVYINDLAKWCGIGFSNSGANPLYYADAVYVNNEKISELVIPDGVTTVSNYAFYGLESIESVTIPDSVTSVGSYALYNCPNLTEVYYNAATVSTELLSQSNYYDNASNVALVVLGDNVTSIDVDAFAGCDELRKIFIPRSVTEIENGAFEDCTNLATVEYGGSQEDWEQVYIGDNNDNLLNAQINYNSLAEDAALTDTDLLTYTVNDDNTITITNCYENAVDIDIPSEINGIPVTAINLSAFANRTKLESVTIPSSVTTIGDRAFYGCTALTEMTIPEGVTNIGNSVFYGCSSLERITIPVSVTSIDNYAFYGCSSLSDVYYAGTEEQWNAVSKGYSNDPLINANIYYNGTKPEPEPTPLPMTTAEITKTDTETGYVFEVTPETAYENCSVYAAVYDENGILIALSRVPLNMEGSTSVEVGKSENDSKASVFIWADTSQPIIIKEDFTL